ncbi:MAG TPA: methyltransferase [Terriglobia bacterium]|nr:methyltransferase [Terriglobia bacterium]
MSDQATATAPTTPAPQNQILGIVTGFWQSRALAIAAELELADLLADGPVSVDILAGRTKTDSLSLFRLMRALEGIGIFRQVSPQVFANTPTSDCLRKNVPGSQWAFVRIQLSRDCGVYGAWAGLMDSVQTGRVNFDQFHGCNFWQYLQRNPGTWTIFNEAMRSLGALMTPAITASYDWNRFPVIADIGGGIGSQLVDILNAHPSCRGILFDLPEVVTDAIPHERVERTGGDFFKSLPAGADAYILRGVIHDWAEPEAIAILKNVRQVMRPDARLVLIEWLIPEGPEPTLGKWIDLIMLTILGGRERTAAEFGELYAKCGFELDEIIPTASPLSIIIGRPHA